MWRCRAASIGERADVGVARVCASRPLAEHGLRDAEEERCLAPCCTTSHTQLLAVLQTPVLRSAQHPAGRFAEDGSPEAKKQRTQGPGYAAKNAGYPLRQVPLSGPQTEQQGLPLDPQQVRSALNCSR